MLGLTQQERQVILFLITVSLIGCGINLLIKMKPAVKSLIFLPQGFGKVNINKADKEALMSIPGIGEKLAERIIVYREEQAGFLDSEELKDIKGITKSRYEKIREHITLE